MIVTVEFPDQLAKQFRLDESARSHELLEAFVFQRFAERKLPTGRVGAVMGLSLHETERFLKDEGTATSITSAEVLRDFANLDRMSPG